MRAILALALTLLMAIFSLPARAQDCPNLDYDATGRTLTIGIKFAPPFVMGGLNEQDGLSIDLWEKIAHCLRLDPDTGYTFENYGTNEDLIDAAERNEIDLAIAAIPIIAENEERIDYSQPYFEAALGTVVADRPRTANFQLLLARIFHTKVLYIILGLIGFMITVGIYYWWIERKNGNEFFEQGPFNGIYRSLIWASLLVFQGRGDPFSLKSRFGQVIVLMLMFFGVTIISSFTAIIASSLTLQGLEPEIKTVDDLRNANVGARLASPAANWALANSITVNSVNSMGTAQRHLDEGAIKAYIDDRELLRYLLANRELKNAKMSELTMLPQNYAIVFPEGSGITEPTNRILLKIIEGQFWERQLLHYFGNN